jgi:putative endonuclease
MRRKKGWLYILRCADGSYYTGSTSQLDQRLHQHELGAIEGFTSQHLPFEVVLALEFEMFYEAAAAEKQVKGWTRKKKEALIAGNFDLLHKLAECKNVTHYRNKTKK